VVVQRRLTLDGNGLWVRDQLRASLTIAKLSQNSAQTVTRQHPAMHYSLTWQSSLQKRRVGFYLALSE